MYHCVLPPYTNWICPETHTPYDATWTAAAEYDSCDQCRPDQIPHIARRPPHLASGTMNFSKPALYVE